MPNQASNLFSCIHSQPLPTGPVRLNSGEVVVDLPKFLRTTSACLAVTREGSWAYSMYLDRLVKVKQRIDEIRGVEQQPVVSSSGAGERAGTETDSGSAAGVQQSLF